MPKKKLLIIEDDKLLSSILLTHMEKEGFEVLTAANARSGMKKALKEHPNLILLDIMMPGMDGLTMLSKLRMDKWGSKVPVVLLSNFSDPYKVKRAEKYKADDYILKAEAQLSDIVRKVKEKIS